MMHGPINIRSVLKIGTLTYVKQLKITKALHCRQSNMEKKGGNITNGVKIRKDLGEVVMNNAMKV